jgi:hypothetical protein
MKLLDWANIAVLIGIAVVAVAMWRQASKRRVDKLSAHEDTRPDDPNAAKVQPKDGPGPRRPT